MLLVAEKPLEIWQHHPKAQFAVNKLSNTGVCCSESPHVFLQCPLNCSTPFFSLSVFPWLNAGQPTPHPVSWPTHTHWPASTSVLSGSWHTREKALFVNTNWCLSSLKSVPFPLLHCGFLYIYKISSALLFLFQMQLKLSNGFQSYRQNCISLI